MHALITGITGFVGSHLAEYILSNHAGCEVHGLKRWRSPKDNILGVLDRVKLYDCDLRDLKSLMEVMREVKPDAVFHLAAQSYVPTSLSAPADTMDVNVIGTVNLLEAIRDSGADPVIHICSSSEVYGQVAKENIPITEDCPLRPASPYAASKVAEDMIGLQYFITYGMKTIRSRMFTHTGPRRGEVFAESAFARQVARIEKGLQEPVLRVGNLDSVRTFADVRDVVRAYWLLVERCVPGEVYNIGGGRTESIGRVLEMLLERSEAKIEVQQDPRLLRPSDVTMQIPDVEKFSRASGWQPVIPLEQTLEDLLDYWREHV